MAENTNIPWCDHTVNFWQGCHKVSAGCANCYMYRDKKRYGQDPGAVTRSKPATFNKPLSWKEPAKVFVCSWSDFFHKAADDWRDDAWDIIRKTPHLTYLLLTKRPENIKDRLPADWPLPNVWLGVTAENQEMADKRIPILLSIPAVKRFVSIEPMVGPVDLAGALQMRAHKESSFHWTYPSLDWVIVGGESGPGARPAHPDWVRSLRDQCKEADTPFMFKQWGEWCPATEEFGVTGSNMPDTGEKYTWMGWDGTTQNPSSHGLVEPVMVVAKQGTKRTGHLLDGVEHMDIPGK